MPGKSGVDAFVELRRTAGTRGDPGLRRHRSPRVPPGDLRSSGAAPRGLPQQTGRRRQARVLCCSHHRNQGRESELTVTDSDLVPVGPTAPDSGAVGLDGCPRQASRCRVSMRTRTSSPIPPCTGGTGTKCPAISRSTTGTSGSSRETDGFVRTSANASVSTATRSTRGATRSVPNCPVEATFLDGKNHPSEQLLTTAAGARSR